MAAAPVRVRTLVLRETVVSMVINAAISAGFFLLAFGFSAPVSPLPFALDFLPQGFMVALMGSLIPSLLVRRRSGAAIGGIVGRAFLIAAVALILLGGGAYALVMTADTVLGPATALSIKAVFGAIVAGCATPVAVYTALRAPARRP